MKRVTFKNVNESIEDLGYELCKGNGYFYFFADDCALPLFDSMVYTNHLNTYSIDEWRKILLAKIADTKNEYLA